MAQVVGALQKIVLTYDDYLRLPNDGRRYEILEGEIFVSPSPVRSIKSYRAISMPSCTITCARTSSV